MKKLSIIILILMISILPCKAEIFEQEISPDSQTTIFIYHIPDDEPEILKNSYEEKPLQDIISDDVTADTSIDDYVMSAPSEDNGTLAISNDDTDDYYPNVLKGYAVYEQEEDDAVILPDNDLDRVLAIRIQKPYNYKGGKYLAQKGIVPLNYSKFSKMEYSITPVAAKQSKTIGSFTTGTTFNQIIDLAELEQSTGVFSRYDTKYFGIYTAYSKTLNSTNSTYNDNFYFSPELKLNQYFTLKEILSADITRNRKKAEFVVALNPFGKRDNDRLRLEFSANATYDYTNTLLKRQLKFSTTFKW